MRFCITPEVFAAFPGMRVVAIFARGLDNSATRPYLEAEWKEVWKAAVSAQEYGNSQSHPRVSPWRTAFQRIGVSGKKFPSSIEALLRRALKGGAPPVINPLVDFYNTISLRHVVPAGGFDVAELGDTIELRMTREGDKFHALDEDTDVGVPSGEVAYAVDNTILTRHFVWRQSRKGLITESTKDVLLVSEILGELPGELADEVQTELLEGLEHFFNTAGAARVLRETTPEATWDAYA